MKTNVTMKSLVLFGMMSLSSVMYGSNDRHHEVMNNNRMEVRHDKHCLDEMRHGHHDKNCKCECHRMDKHMDKNDMRMDNKQMMSDRQMNVINNQTNNRQMNNNRR